MNRVLIDTSGKIIAVGSFTQYNGASIGRVARFNSDGTLDSSFAPAGSRFNNTVSAAQLDNSGKIVVGGSFTQYNGASVPYVARLNTDGSLDSTFNTTGTGLDSPVDGLTIDSSGNIVVGGVFSHYNGISTPHVARLTVSGSLDGTFVQTKTGLNNTIYGIAIDGSGNILAVGLVTAYNGISINSLVRMTSTGALDGTFAIGTNLNGWAGSIALDSAGRIIIGGGFNQYGATNVDYVARILNNGNLDTSFLPTGTGLNNVLNGLCIDSSNRVIVAGGILPGETHSAYFQAA